MSSAPPTRMSHRLWEKTQPWHTPDSASNNRHNSSITFPSSSRAKQRGLVIKLVVRVQNFQPAFRPIDNTDTERERDRERGWEKIFGPLFHIALQQRISCASIIFYYSIIDRPFSIIDLFSPLSLFLRKISSSKDSKDNIIPIFDRFDFIIFFFCFLRFKLLSSSSFLSRSLVRGLFYRFFASRVTNREKIKTPRRTISIHTVFKRRPA